MASRGGVSAAGRRAGALFAELSERNSYRKSFRERVPDPMYACSGHGGVRAALRFATLGDVGLLPVEDGSNLCDFQR